MLTKKKISIIPVAYKDEGNIEELYKRVTKVMQEVASNYEIIYINDASPDKSQEILEKLASKDKKLTVMTHSRNFGVQSAFTTGMIQSLGDAVVIMDGDLQDPPELIPEFIKKWQEGYDVVYGHRSKREKGMGRFWEFAMHKFYEFLNSISYVKPLVDVGEFSLMDRKIVDIINALPEKDRFIRGMRAWTGFKQTGVSYIRPERFWGAGVATSSITRRLYWVRKAIFNFSYAPLDWVFYAAIAGVFVSIIFLLFYIISKTFFPSLINEVSLTAVLVIFVGSIQLISISIICEYLQRIFEEVKNRPYSVVKSIINDHKLSKR
ncbi:glycosyltransferase [candidate division WWE3 bacterium CG08_land_8_20_14_0_20_40_13]|uniref:Glycosyltransferase n=1 Tax=candidate division WWE3 bacterium CG08_land_8_20_14_0_20_40_13 TaxID=1975084 RepID=A0A2H0XE89_UNCKA|nr:MAG: glycosyltransferase [candidate division WWE3 bacterium CG08_land_8_20_14_0_20_40_13]